MINILLSGCNGRMGQAVTRIAAELPDVTIIAGVDINPAQLSAYPVFSSFAAFGGKADVIVDFSSATTQPPVLPALLEHASTRSLPAVLCTTGYSSEQEDAIRRASLAVPLFKSPNMSLGVNLLRALVRSAARVLGSGWDIEIVERHHRTKVDAPSGTALMLYEAAAGELRREVEPVYDRHARREVRPDGEIGLHAVRGGGIVGDHSVIFASRDEVIELSHSALSREAFASGAISAARYMASVKKPGLYCMDDFVRAD